MVPMVQPMASRLPILSAKSIAADRRHDQVAEDEQHSGDGDG